MCKRNLKKVICMVLAMVMMFSTTVMAAQIPDGEVAEPAAYTVWYHEQVSGQLNFDTGANTTETMYVTVTGTFGITYSEGYYYHITSFVYEDIDVSFRTGEDADVVVNKNGNPPEITYNNGKVAFPMSVNNIFYIVQIEFDEYGDSYMSIVKVFP